MSMQLSDRRLPLALASILTALVCGMMLASCGHKTDEKVANKAPFVRLTGGPVARAPGQNGIPLTDSVNYSTEFLWSGWDEDGIIDHYQYALDIPDNLLGELNNPNPSGIAWVDTTAFRAHFLFSATHQDTILDPSSGTITLPNQYRSDHTFYVRAVDNEGAVSQAAHVTFTARTITPITTFTLPASLKAGQALLVGRILNVVWEGVDPDSPDPRKKPKYYEWKLFSLDPYYAINVGEDIAWWVTDSTDTHTALGLNFPWHRVGADTTRLTLNLETGHDYIFVVRAIDEAGGVENKFFRGQNAAVISSSDANHGTPKLTVKEKMAGSFLFEGAPDIVWEVETPVGRCLRFDFQGDASDYGGEVQGYNYGIDVIDAEQDGPNSGFRGWSLLKYTYEPICFRSPGVHALTIKCRDTGGGVTIATVILKVIAFPMDREILYVDDVIDRSGVAMPDSKMDSRILDMLTSIGYTTTDKDPKKIFQLDTFGPNDQNPAPELVKLSDLARYKYIVWSVNGVAYNQNPALVSANACESGRVLQAYVGAGGGLWVFGQRVYAAFRKDSRYAECKSFLGYNESINEGLMFTTPGQFIYDFLGVTDGGNFHTEEKSTTNGVVRVSPNPAAAAAEIPFPPVEVDSTILKLSLGGIPYCDVMYQQSFDHTGGLDTVYTVKTAAAARNAFVGKAIGLSYADPDRASPEQGPVIIFGMPPAYLKLGQVHPVEGSENYVGTGTRGMAAAVFAWFRQNGPPARAALQP